MTNAACGIHLHLSQQRLSKDWKLVDTNHLKHTVTETGVIKKKMAQVRTKETKFRRLEGLRVCGVCADFL